MPRMTKVAKAEKALEQGAAAKGLTGRRAGQYVFGALNNIGLKRGSKTTKRGAQKAKKG